MSVSYVKMTKDEEKLFHDYCESHNISLSDAFKEALLEKIEDELDAKELDNAIDEFHRNPKTYTLDEVEKMIN